MEDSSFSYVSKSLSNSNLNNDKKEEHTETCGNTSSLISPRKDEVNKSIGATEQEIRTDSMDYPTANVAVLVKKPIPKQQLQSPHDDEKPMISQSHSSLVASFLSRAWKNIFSGGDNSYVPHDRKGDERVTSLKHKESRHAAQTNKVVPAKI
jgi:hypothetical protein